MVLTELVFQSVIQERLYVQHCIFVGEDFIFFLVVIVIFGSTVEYFAKVVRRWHLVFITCDDNRLAFQHSRQVVFEFQLTCLVKHHIVEIEIFALKQIATSIGGGEDNREETRKEVGVFHRYLSQGKAVVLFTFAFVVEVRHSEFFVSLFKCFYSFALLGIPVALDKILLGRGEVVYFLFKIGVILLVEV